MIRVKAMFKGADGSLGYRTGKDYILIVGAPLSDRPTVQIGLADAQHARQGYCIYKNIETFLLNWTKIEEV